MFALDLFNTRYERDLREGAVDDLEARRIDDLNAKMQDLLARARNASPEMKAGLKREFDKVKNERDSYFKIKDECMGYGTMVGETDAPVQRPSGSPWAHVKSGAPNKGLPDIANKAEKMARATPSTPAGKVASTVKNAAKWLAGKGGPGQEGPTYEATATAPRAFGVGNFQRLVKANMGNRPYVDLEFANPADNLKLDQAGLDLISDYYDGLETDQAKNHFIYRVLPSADEVKTILTKLGWNSAGQQQLPLAEKKKFNNSSDLEAGDVKVARELQKLRAQYPAAKSDVEAVAKAELDGTERSQQQLAAIKGANEKQDALLKQLVSLDQEQGRELDDLDQENNTLEKRLARVQATNDRLQQTVSQIAATKKVDSKSDQAKADTPNKTNQDDEEDDVEPAIDLIPDAPVDNTPTPKAKPKAAPKKVYRKRKEKTPKPDTFGQVAQQIAGFPTVAPEVKRKEVKRKADTAITAIKEPENTVAQEPSEPEDDVVQRPGSLKALRPKVATNADDFKLVAEHGGGIGPKQHWQDLMQENKLAVGDPVIVTAPNEFEGATGEIHELSPSGKFIIVNLYNHGKHSMHLSDVEYNQYADKQEEDDWYDEMEEGWSNKMVAQRTGQLPTPYSVYIKGKEWKSFADDNHAENVANKLRAKFKQEGKDPSVITIAPTDYDKNVKEDTGSWIVYDPETKQIKKRFKTHTAGKSYAKTHGLGFASSEYYFDNIKQPVNELDVNTLKSYADKRGAQVAAMKADNPNPVAGSKEWVQQAVPAQQVNLAKRKIARKERQQGVVEAQTDYQKRRQRERDIDAGRPVAKQRQSKMTDYQKKRAQDKKDMELGEGLMKDPTNRKEYLDQRDKLFRMLALEKDSASRQIIKQAISDLDARFGSAKDTVKEESSTSSDAVERAILNRIMVAHTDLLMKFGPEKVMQAAEEVAYNVGDVDEIGTSDVSAYVAQVKQILGVPEELDEKWSQKYKSSINCANPKGFSQKAHCADRKK
jgi:hypothetical protein